jgi:predicted  nucleic acid-binding Zn-ribbon protein
VTFARALPLPWLASSLVALLIGGLVWAQESDPASGPEREDGVAAIRSAIAALEVQELEATYRETLVGIYQEALGHAERADELRIKAQQLEAEASEVPRLLEQVREVLAHPPEDVEPQVPADADLAAVDALRLRAENALSAAREALQVLRTEAARRTERQAASSEALARLRRRVQELREQGEAGGGEELPSEQRRALVVLRQAHLRSLLAEVQALEAELSNYEARRELLPARIDRAARDVAVAEDLAKEWQALASEVRKREAERAEREAEQAAREAEAKLRREATERVPQLLALADVNKVLASKRTGPEGLTAELGGLDQDLARFETRLGDLRATYASVRRKVRVAGLTNAMGQLLRKHLDALPDTRELQREAARRQERISNVQLELIEREDERSEVGDVGRRLQELLASLTPAERARVGSSSRPPRNTAATSSGGSSGSAACRGVGSPASGMQPRPWPGWPTQPEPASPSIWRAGRRANGGSR